MDTFAAYGVWYNVQAREGLCVHAQMTSWAMEAKNLLELIIHVVAMTMRNGKALSLERKRRLATCVLRRASGG